jgi:hypothetical protein
LQTLLKARGHGPVDTATPQVQFDSAFALTNVCALYPLWRDIGFDCIAGVFRRGWTISRRLTTAWPTCCVP